jgi:hypothetical protein
MENILSKSQNGAVFSSVQTGFKIILISNQQGFTHSLEYLSAREQGIYNNRFCTPCQGDLVFLEIFCRRL